MAKKESRLKKLFSQPLFPKGTGGIFPKYDKALKKKQIESLEDDLVGTTSAVGTKRSPRAAGAEKMSLTKSKSPRAAGAEKIEPTMTSFSKAFQEAREAGKKSFTYDGKQFAAVTKQEVEDKGFDSLRDYLNAQFKNRID